MDSCERDQGGVPRICAKTRQPDGPVGIRVCLLKLHTDQADLTLELHGNSEATAGIRHFQCVRLDLHNF